MGKKMTDEGIELLRNNKNVVKCSDKTITYSNEFKLLAVKQYEEGMASREIFAQAGFDLKALGKDVPKGRLRDWNKKYKARGIKGLIEETRGRGGGRPKNEWINDKERIEFLEAKVAYLKAENDFLARLRKGGK